jgi:hypothetical protein
MREFRRLLLLAAALTVTGAVGAANAQTVVVTKAPPGATVELGLNADAIGTAKADAAGIATLPVNLTAHGRRAETDARIFVDVCEQARRVTLVEVGWQPPPPAAGCTRREIFGVFYLKSVTTVVVSAAEQAQAVWIKQGPAPESWLKDAPTGNSRDDRPGPGVPSGLVFFGSAGISNYANAAAVSCGAGTECASDESRLSGRFGGEYWVRPFVGVSVSYLKPGAATTNGSGSGYRFNSSLSPNLVTITGKVGVPFGRVRLYGEVGTDYNWTTLSTTETLDETTLTLDDGSTTVVPGGTQNFELKTDGWNWTWGAGAEVWIAQKAAVFGEFSWAKVTGKTSGGGEGSLDETLMSIFVGIRFRLSGKT